MRRPTSPLKTWQETGDVCYFKIETRGPRKGDATTVAIEGTPVPEIGSNEALSALVKAILRIKKGPHFFKALRDFCDGFETETADLRIPEELLSGSSNENAARASLEVRPR